MKLPPRHKEAFKRLGLHAIYAVGPPHVVRWQDETQHQLMLEVLRSGVSSNGPHETELVHTFWPVRWGLSGDCSDAIVTQANGWQFAIHVQLLARVWFESKAHAGIVYEAIKSSVETMRLNWVNQGNPTLREWLELEVKGLAQEQGLRALDDYEMACVLDDMVFRKYERDVRGHAART